MKLTLIQMNSGSDKAANVAMAQQLIDSAVRLENPDWICLPEVFDFLGGNQAAKLSAAEFLGSGPAYRMLQDCARRHKIYIHGGSLLEKLPDQQRLANTTVIFNPLGEEIAIYRKIHMFDTTTPDGQTYQESAFFQPGNEIVTYASNEFNVGCAICYDIRFPNLFQVLRERGAELIALPAAFVLQTGKDHWEVLLRARAIETQCYVAAAAQIGSHHHNSENRFTYGHSMIIDPWGHVIARASDEVGFVSAPIRSDFLHKIRKLMPIHSHKRNLY